jgi:hypothetical protein
MQRQQSCRLDSSNGTLWFATVGGVVKVNPARLRINPLAPPVHIEALYVDNAPLALEAEPALPPAARQIELQFTALSLVVPQRVRFRYKLEGHDPDGIDAGERRAAHYGNLPAGRYRFRVLACNNDGVWNESGAAFSLRQRPRFTRRRPFAAEPWGFSRFSRGARIGFAFASFNFGKSS